MDVVDAIDRNTAAIHELTRAVYALAEHTAPTDYQRENAGARYDSLYPRDKES